MCEGPNEREIINILLENDLLKFTEDDLLGLTPSSVIGILRVPALVLVLSM